MANDGLYDLYKQVRNKIRCYNPVSLIAPAVDILHKMYATGPDLYDRYQPWDLLLIVKWTAMEADGTSHRRLIASSADFHAILAAVRAMGDKAHIPEKYPNIMLLMRQFAFQQFWLQGDVSGESIGRQYVLFAEREINHRFQTLFKELTGISIADFSSLSAGLLSIALHQPSPRAIRHSDFAQLEPHLTPEATHKFFRFLSKSLFELQQWLNSDDLRRVSISNQRIMPTPLLSVPLLKEGDHYAVYSPLLLIRSLESVVYRTLRQNDSSSFGNAFGPLFEGYVARCFDEAGLCPLRENEIKAHLVGSGKGIGN